MSALFLLFLPIIRVRRRVRRLLLLLPLPPHGVRVFLIRVLFILLRLHNVCLLLRLPLLLRLRLRLRRRLRRLLPVLFMCHEIQRLLFAGSLLKRAIRKMCLPLQFCKYTP